MQRCAIYTRKSTEEGLEQDFNSLDAQREACAAYVQSQKGAGWRLLRARYDDGGLSGATMERPALQRLLQAVEGRQVDIVVVYKVDRLTRSLTDFARIVDIFDAKGVSFVSVTQQFNTTTSMGRLTLNVLLSFAQFEREVTAERIRDKIAASKKKGLWMGGPVPLGYDVQDRKLVVNGAEAEVVQLIFSRYLTLGSVRRLKDEADRRGLVTKWRTSGSGRATGGRPFSRGNLYQLLANPIYAGRIPHRGESYPGQHEAIIDSETWTRVQEQLRANARRRRSATNATSPSLLTGLVFDEAGDRLCPTHAAKGGRRYRYYISKRLMHDRHKHTDGWRLPARELEALVQKLLGEILGVSQRQESRSADAPLDERDGSEQVLSKGTLEERQALIHDAIQRIDLSPTEIRLSLRTSVLGAQAREPRDATASPSHRQFTFSIALRRRGVERKVVIQSGANQRPEPDPVLCRLIGRAHSWVRQLARGEAASVKAIAAREGLDGSDVSRILPLAFLAPDIVEGILEGRQPPELTARTLMRLQPLPADWQAQRRRLGFPPQS